MGRFFCETFKQNFKYFKGLIVNINSQNLIKSIPTPLKPVHKFIAMQEGDSGLSHIRFIQDTATNMVPKAVFARSKADLADMSFLEVTESILVYYFPSLFGEKIFRKAYGKGLSESLKSKIATPATELLKNKDSEETKKLMPVKAAIALSCMLIPLTEYTLNYVKNLFTLKIFKKADFDNIANLNKEQKETLEKQEEVRKSAKRHIFGAFGAFLGCLAMSLLILKKGGSSKFLKGFSEFILAPGNKLFPKNQNKADFVNKYFSIDFANNNSKLGLSHGQLTSCVLIGGLGYFGAAKDRGKQNFLEVLFRLPLVGFYVITGSELLEKALKSFLHKKGMFKELIDEKMNVPALKALPELAEKLALKNNSTVKTEFNKLFKQKAVVTMLPHIFSIGIMGFFVAGISRFFTQYRYNKENNNKTPQPIKTYMS